MTPEIRELFAVLSPLSPEERDREFKRRATAPLVRAEVEQLLAADALTDSLIAEPIRQAAADLAARSASLRLGVWQTESLLGQGGMGVVYKARRVDGAAEQTAAIKLLYRGLETRELLERFQRERTILASLSHPNIARFLDAGTTAEGLPWFAMDFIDGIPIDRWCDVQNLSAAVRVRLLLPVCDAVQHAHRHLVIHRDLKPANILVNTEGIPQLLDFGIAQIIGQTRPDGAATLVMTPDYASPEQLRGAPTTTSTDIYLLGAVLNRLLGARPSGDLDNIVRRAMHEDPARRYATPTELATDLTSWLQGRPVTATPDSFLYRTRRFISRHRWPVAIAALAFAATGVSAVIALQQARNAEKQFRDVRSLATVFLFDFETAIRNLDGATKARELVVETARKYLDKLNSQDPRDPALQRELADAYLKLARIQGGQTFSSTSHRAEAIESFHRTLALRKVLGDDRSTNPELRRTWILVTGNLVATLENTQRLAEAKALSTDSVSNAEAFVRELPQSRDAVRALYSAHHSRAALCLELGDSECAIASAGRSLEVIQALALRLPDDRRVQLDTAAAEFYVVQTSFSYGKFPVARTTATRLVDRIEAIEKRWPPTPESRRTALLAWKSLGNSLATDSPDLPADTDGAVSALRHTIAMATAIRNRDLKNELAMEDLMLATSQLGSTLAPVRPSEAVAVLTPAMAELLAYTREHPDNMNVRKTLADMHNDLGLAFSLEHRVGEALQQHLSALAISDRILTQIPSDGISRKARLISLIRLAGAELALDGPARAELRLDQAEMELSGLLRDAPSDSSLKELSARISQLREAAPKKLR